jgi:replicative superfamily II helicase
MPPNKKLNDQNDLIKTEQFKHASFPFDEFNPVQSRVFEVFDKKANLIIAAATSAGKTVCAEMFISHEVRERGGKAMYLAPLKALSQEKIDDWQDDKHHFKDLNLSICTGDYRLTAARKKELEESNIILMTSEMLNSRCRNDKSEKNQFLRDIGTLVVDESHLLTVPGRGDHLEAGLMKLTMINPEVRVVFLSATMPNVDEISEWVSYALTGRDTYLLESTYRPCPLTLHYESYWDMGGTYDENEAQKVNQALAIIESYPDDKFLVFAHTKRTGEMMKKMIKSTGEQCEFHNADLEKKKRVELEHKFRTDPKFRCIVATSTLAWGLNMPARRVIILGVHRGLDEVATYDVTQMVGRAGRVGYDPCGDAYILLPESKFDYHKARLTKPQKIKSQMLDDAFGHHKVLAFHLVSEIHHGNIRTVQDIHEWYDRSLAHWQEHELEEDIVEKTIDLLRKCRAIYEDDEGVLSASSVGKISSLFYYSPFDVSDLRDNFKNLFESGLHNDDHAVSIALGNVDTHRMGIVSRLERENMGSYLSTSIRKFPGVYEPAIKAGYCYHQLLHGRSSAVFAGFQRGLQMDFARLIEVLNAIDSMSARWGKRDYIKKLNLRIKYGVRGDLVYLCEIPNVGKVRAEKLWKAGLRTVADVANNPGKVQEALKFKSERVAKVCEDAASLL